MKSLNRVTLMGNLAADVELKELGSGKKIATFPIAINRSVVAKSGEFTEKTDYHRITVWNKLAEISQKFLSKGAQLYLEGKLVNKVYESSKGEKQYRNDIYADRLYFIGWKKQKTGQDLLEFEDLRSKAK